MVQPERRSLEQQNLLKRKTVDNMIQLSAVEWLNRYPGGPKEAEKELRARAGESHPAHAINPRHYWEQVLGVFLALARRA